MKRRKFYRSVGIYVSSAASLFAGHSAAAKPPVVKETTKSGNKKSFGDPAYGSGNGISVLNRGMASDSADRYPWRREIVTTTFWIGEKAAPNNPVPNRKSCWDPNWAEDYGGTDTPERAGRTAEFIPSGFIPRQNPFYVALPYNDKMREGHKPEAANVIPWFQQAFKGPDASVCKGRWIAIRRGDRVCYAQWEDAGPFRTDHWQYVFGNERPKPNLNKGAGLDVSPAVRDYLGMDDTDVTDWKFVDFDEVPAGPWDRFGDNNTFVINRRAAERQVAAADRGLPPKPKVD